MAVILAHILREMKKTDTETISKLKKIRSDSTINEILVLIFSSARFRKLIMNMKKKTLYSEGNLRPLK